MEIDELIQKYYIRLYGDDHIMVWAYHPSDVPDEIREKKQEILRELKRRKERGD